MVPKGTFITLETCARHPEILPRSTKERTPTTTIEWLLKNVPRNNGRVGMLGISSTMLDDGSWERSSHIRHSSDFAAGIPGRHVARRRFSPQRSVSPQLGIRIRSDDGKRKDVQQFAFDRYDTFDWYPALGPRQRSTRTPPAWEDTDVE
jgi:hypothetical protein